jgi:Phage tail tube protein.
MAQYLGIVDLIWGGKKMPVEKGAKFKPGGLKNNVVIVGRRAGRAQEFVASEVTATTVLERGKSFSDLYTVEEGELQIVCDTGQTFIIADAFLTDRPDVTGGEGGKIELKWSGSETQEIQT